jgi:hypothetical protein
MRERTEGGTDGITCVRCTELRGLTEVAVVETADFCTLADRARRGELDGPASGASLSSARCVRLW